MGISAELEHTLPDSWVELKGRGANLLGLNENAPAANVLKESISTLPLMTRAYAWAETTRAGLMATFTT